MGLQAGRELIFLLKINCPGAPDGASKRSVSPMLYHFTDGYMGLSHYNSHWMD